MDRLPVELLRSILVHAEIDAGLTHFAGACRKFTLSSHSTTSNNAFNWDFALKFLVYTQHTAAIDYLIGNRLFVTTGDVLLGVLRSACNTGRADIVSLLLTCPTSDTSPFDDALMAAARCRQLKCVKAILHDPLQRVTCAGIDRAMWLSCCNGSYRIVTVLIGHGVSVSALNSGLTAAVSSGSKELVSLLLQQPEVDPSLDNNACLKESVLRNSNDEIARLLLSDKRVSISTEGHAVVQTALFNKKTSHALLFLEVAEQLKDVDALWAMDAFLNEAGALDSRRTMFARISVHCKG